VNVSDPTAVAVSTIDGIAAWVLGDAKVIVGEPEITISRSDSLTVMAEPIAVEFSRTSRVAGHVRLRGGVADIVPIGASSLYDALIR
jgi:hypothetical protein